MKESNLIVKLARYLKNTLKNKHKKLYMLEMHSFVTIITEFGNRDAMK